MKPGYLCLGHEELDRSGLSRRAPDEPEALELDDHLVNAGWGDAEEALEVGLGRWLTVEQDVRVDERQVLALLVREARGGGRAGHADADLIKGSSKEPL